MGLLYGSFRSLTFLSANRVQEHWAPLLPGPRPKKQQIKSENGELKYIVPNLGSVRITNAFQQLLTIWRKAKGKERDALLWGDEVCSQWRAVVG